MSGSWRTGTPRCTDESPVQGMKLVTQLQHLIDQLQNEVTHPRDRVNHIHRNEWPKLWEIIDRIVAAEPTEYMLTDGRTVSADEVWEEMQRAKDEVVQSGGVGAVEAAYGEPVELPISFGHALDMSFEPETVVFDDLSAKGDMLEDESNVHSINGVRYLFEKVHRDGKITYYPPPEDERSKIPLSEIVSFVGTDPKMWAMWFMAFLEDEPDASLDMIEEWFSLALTAGAIQEAESFPPVEATFDEDGHVKEMRVLIKGDLTQGEWQSEEGY